MKYLAPELLFHQGHLQSNLVVAINPGTGLIDSVRNQGSLPPDAEVEYLQGKALLPGFTNAHSHAFQRLLRGSTEYRNPAHPHDDFWSWRELMYRSALTVDPEQLETVAQALFLEMLSFGITTVGEFHYLHHDKDGRPYADRDELAMRLFSAADQVGIRIVMLRVAYHRAGFNQPPNPRQCRFLENDPQDCLSSVQRFLQMGRMAGVAPHSLRAVPRTWFSELREFARQHQLPLHMHVAEQPRELEECLAEYGCRPVELLEHEGLLGPYFTGVHLIHLNSSEIQTLGSQNCTVCSCPTTERNLGDGIVQADELLRLGCRFALGSDSQCQIDPLEDARQLEYHLRLYHRQRGLLPTTAQDASSGESVTHEIAGKLLEIATEGGARSLGLIGGKIAAGNVADFVQIDLDHPSLLGLGSPLTRIVFGLPREAIERVFVNGKVVWNQGHPLQDSITSCFRKVLRQLSDTP